MIVLEIILNVGIGAVIFWAGRASAGRKGLPGWPIEAHEALHLDAEMILALRQQVTELCQTIKVMLMTAPPSAEADRVLGVVNDRLERFDSDGMESLYVNQSKRHSAYARALGSDIDA